MDLKTAQDNVQTHPYAACFFSQQAAEKALKALAIGEAGTYPRAHDLMGTLKSLPGLQNLIRWQDVTLLDSFDIATRYPDAWPGGIPAERFTPEQAREAYDRAAETVDTCTRLLARWEKADADAAGGDAEGPDTNQ